MSSQKYLEAFNYTGNNLMLKTRVLALSILPDHDDINIFVARGEPRQIKAMDERGVEIELPPQSHIEGADASAHGSPQPSFEADLIPLNRLKHLRRDALHIALDVELLEKHGCVNRLHDLFDSAGDERTDAVSRDESDRAWGSVAGAGHVGDGSGGEEIPDDRKSATGHLDRW